MAERMTSGDSLLPLSATGSREPIAVVAAGCRFPGSADDPEAYWQFLHDGGDAVGPVPATRWGADGAGTARAYAHHMATLDGIDGFDAGFFGISPREAASMDPQHRLLLEVAWEAVERAAWSPRLLAGSQTGVFIGIYSDDYAQERLYRREAAQIDGHAGLAMMRSLAAGRIAYALDLRGPVMALDAACASSLLAIHLACRSLHAGECDRALAGGVNLVLAPEITLALCEMKALSPSGRCRTFSADADGFVRGEGCGVVALRRLSDALRYGDPVLGVIRGSAVNHDGRSNGISAPNGAAQQAVLRAALADADVPAASVGFVEAHGTGTILGDPIELRALDAVYGAERASPLLVGSAKTNFGHLEAAAGVAGFLKVVMALRHGEVPSNLHFTAPNPHVAWDTLGLAVPTAPQPLPVGDVPLRGAVSAFGMSGTNVHVILEAPPQLDDTPPAPHSHYLAALSARSEAALRASALRHARVLAAVPSADPAAVARTLNAGRGAFPVRAAVPFTDVATLAAQLADLGDIAPAAAGRPKLMFAFADGTQRPPDGGQALIASAPAFAAAVTACAEHGLSLTEDADDVSAFVLSYALAALWRSWGLVPDRVSGQGAGEVVAAYVAGVLPLAQVGALLRARRAATAGGSEAEAGRLGFLAAVRALDLHPPQVPLVSGLMGREIGAEATSPSYWWAQLTAVPAAPAPPDAGSCVIPIAAAGAHWCELVSHLGAAHCAGLDPDWAAVDAPCRRLALGTYPFEHGSYFIPRPDAEIIGGGRGLAGQRLDVAGREETRFALDLGVSRLAYLREHRFGGQAIFPMAGLVEIALRNAEALGAGRAIENLLVMQPLHVPDEGRLEVQSVLAADGGWQLFARRASGKWMLHATARVDSSADASAPRAAAVPEMAPGARTPGAAIYGGLTEHGFAYGPAFRGLEHFALDADGVSAQAQVPPSAGLSTDYVLHPALLDACLVCASAILPPQLPGFTWMPQGIARVAVFAPGARSVTCTLRLQPESTERYCRIDLVLQDAAGHPVAQLDGAVFIQAAQERAIVEDEGLATQADLLSVRWQRMELSAAPSSRLFALLGDEPEQVAHLARALSDLGSSVVEVPPAVGVDAEACKRWLSNTLADAPDGRCQIVYLATAHADPAASVVPPSYSGLLRLAQAIAGSSHRAALRLDLVTRGTQRVGSEPVNGVVEAGLWGLARVVAREYPDLPQSRIDLDPQPEQAADTEMADLAACLSSAPAGEELALRRGVCLVGRLAMDRPNDPDHAVALPVFDGQGPGPGEVIIDVVASGLNFRDVLHGMGLLADSADHMPYGLECAGVIAAIGPGVEGLSVNMPVMAGLTVGSLAGRVRVPAAFVVPKPEDLSFRDAATLPLAFLTAHYALDHLAQIKPGDRVLIHAAAGGVGQAAIQVAQRAGAEVFATASPGKWSYLQRQGVAHVFNSRSTDFAAEIRRLTDGRGVDVVLNSLSGEAIAASFAALADGGRFIEIGKMGVWSAEAVAALGRDIAYHRFDLWDIKRDHRLIAGMMAQMLARLSDGSLRPLRSELFAIENVGAAFQQMARARHMGKIVLWQAAAGASGLVRPDATFLITGGLGTLGLHAARWLVHQGARSLALVGRSAPGPEAETTLVALRAAGVRVEIFQADMSGPAAVDQVFASVRATMAPLRGVIHAAGVLDDALLVNQSEAHFAKVLAPKLKAAWLLHQATVDEPLDLFLLYASASGVLGTAGQANYAAANAALDALAAHRAGFGLAALAVDWGPWDGAGMAAGLNDGDAMGRISPAAGAAVLDRLLVHRPGHVVVLPGGWQAGLASGGPATGLLAGLAPQRPAEDAAAPEFRRRLEGAGGAERLRLLRAHVRALAATALEFPAPEAVDPSRPLEDIGFDSLMNMELKAALEKDLGVSLRATLAYDYPSIDALVRHLIADVLQWRESDVPPADAGTDDGEAERALLAELNALKY